MICPECGGTFEPQHHRAQFCSPAHAKAYNNRQLARGQRLVGLAQAWRLGRHFGPSADPELKAAAAQAFRDLCRIADEFNAEDRAEGRVPALKVYRRRQTAGLLDR